MADSPKFLVLEARFLAGTYGGLEWPPAPFRLLQAMVAGCRSVEAPGLRWLELQAAPFILATDEPDRVQFRRSIPNNADPKKPQALLSMRDVIHRRVEAPVRYAYSLRQPADLAAATDVIATAQGVHTLGTGEDMCSVRGWIADSAPDSRDRVHLWVPLPQPGGMRTDGDALLRVAVPGSLQSLEARFQAFQRRLASGAEGYARPVAAPALHAARVYRRSADTPRSALVAMRLVQPGDGSAMRRFHAEDAVIVAGMLRHAAMRLADAQVPSLADFAAGYGPEGDPSCRLSWVPLPSVGHQHADGMIRRGLLLARAQDAQNLGELAAHLPIDGLPLVDEHTGECVAVAAPLDTDEEPVLHQYLGASRHWSSVTPVVLPGDFGGNDLRVLNKLLLKALRESGIDPGLLEQVEFSKTGFSRQAARLRDVKLKEWKAKHLILYHVRLVFRQAVRGPVVLGRGRHFGLGLCCANPE